GPISADRKVYSDYRVSLVPGSVKEVRIVKEIFRRYVELRESVTQVMRAINASGATTRNGRQWCLNNIIHILENEKYAGSQVYGMTSRKLGTTITQRNPSSEWVRKPNAFPSIVDPEVFEKARELRREAREKWSDEELLRMLRRLLARRGRLTQRMIERQKG